MSSRKLYERPQLVDLNQPDWPESIASCGYGTRFGSQGNKCGSGANARSICNNGNGVNPCLKGSGAAGSCSTGSNATTSCSPGAAR